MVYVTLAALAAAVLEVLTFARIISTQARAHARREDLLVNQICSLAGKPWEPPPAREPFTATHSSSGVVRNLDQQPTLTLVE